MHQKIIVPMYTYIVYTLLIEVIHTQDGISVFIQDFFNALGIIITSLVTLYYIFIIKLIDIIHDSPLTPMKIIKEKIIHFYNGKDKLYRRSTNTNNNENNSVANQLTFRSEDK